MKTLNAEELLKEIEISAPQKIRSAQRDLEVYKMAVEFMIVADFIKRDKFKEALQLAKSLQNQS